MATGLLFTALALVGASCREGAAPAAGTPATGTATTAGTTTSAATGTGTIAVVGAANGTGAATGAGSAAPAAPTASVGCSASCTDALHARVCDDDGKPSDLDCGAKGRRCVRGVCAERLCKPGALHCDQGQLYRCDAAGAARTLEKACRPDNGVCLDDPKKGGAKCIQSCDKSLMNVALATYDCAECDFKGVPFCAKSGSETSCSESLCQNGEIGFGVSMFDCQRDTDGLVVPGSEKKGACEKGLVKVKYDVCVDGKPQPRTRADGC